VYTFSFSEGAVVQWLVLHWTSVHWLPGETNSWEDDWIIQRINLWTQRKSLIKSIPYLKHNNYVSYIFVNMSVYMYMYCQ